MNVSVKSRAPVFSAIAAARRNGFSSPAWPPIRSRVGSPERNAATASLMSFWSTGLPTGLVHGVRAGPAGMSDHAMSAGTMSVDMPPFGRIAQSKACRALATASCALVGSPIQSETGFAIE